MDKPKLFENTISTMSTELFGDLDGLLDATINVDVKIEAVDDLHEITQACKEQIQAGHTKGINIKGHLFKVEKEKVETTRASAPSLQQLEKLVCCMETKPWLATGRARTATARIRSHTAWSDIASTLNSDARGCVKSWQQWLKYWQDKKGAIKRKANAISVARRRTDVGTEEIAELSDIEEKILLIMGGEQFVTSDKHLEIDPFQETPNLTNDTAGNNSQSQNSQSILQTKPAAAVLGEESVRDTMVSSPTPGPSIRTVAADVHPAYRPSHATDKTVHISFNNGNREALLATQVETIQVDNTSSPAQRRQEVMRRRLSQPSPARSAERRRLLQPSPARPAVHRRLLQASPARPAVLRRLLRRSPPRQRRSEMASLTERFIAIEERRAQTELITARSHELLARSHELYAQGLQAIASSVAQLAQALNPLVERLMKSNNN